MKIKAIIMTPNGVYKECECSIINVLSSDGQRGILPGHMPLVLSLIIGKIELEENDGRHIYATSGGMLYFKDNECRILVDTIESAGDIDLDRALEAKKRALERLKNRSDNDFKRASIALKKAINRIDVKEKISN